jgi:hypothetical protein
MLGEPCLTLDSKDIEKQIKGIQDKSDKIKQEVGWLDAEGYTFADICIDYPGTVVGTTVTASGSSIINYAELEKDMTIRYPLRLHSLGFLAPPGIKGMRKLGYSSVHCVTMRP